VETLWLCGPSGVGKSTVGWAVFSQLCSDGVKAGYVDLDQISFCRPADEDDPQNHRLRGRNLTTMWRNYRDAGARRLVVSGIVNTATEVERYVNGLPELALTIVRLRASHETLRERVFMRGEGAGPPLAGDELRGAAYAYLTQVVELTTQEADEMDREGFGDVVIDTDGLPVAEVARRVLEVARPKI
jgi:AAA domain